MPVSISQLTSVSLLIHRNLAANQEFTITVIVTCISINFYAIHTTNKMWHTGKVPLKTLFCHQLFKELGVVTRSDSYIKFFIIALPLNCPMCMLLEGINCVCENKNKQKLYAIMERPINEGGGFSFAKILKFKFMWSSLSLFLQSCINA